LNYCDGDEPAFFGWRGDRCRLCRHTLGNFGVPWRTLSYSLRASSPSRAYCWRAALLPIGRASSAPNACVCSSPAPRRPRKVNLDGNAASHRALRLLRQENPEWRSVVVRSRRYLNNIVKRQFSFGRGRPRRFCSLKHLWARALACHDAATDWRKATVRALNRQCTRTQALAC
jgi:hypothetical protein